MLVYTICNGYTVLTGVREMVLVGIEVGIVSGDFGVSLLDCGVYWWRSWYFTIRRISEVGKTRLE